MCEFQDLTGSTIIWPKPGDVAFTPASRGLGAEVSQDRHGRLVMMMTGYKEAADHLVQKTVDEPYQRNSLVYPILFNYRQFVELNLKYLIASYGATVGIKANWQSHDLGKLWGIFQTMEDAYAIEDHDHANRAVAGIVGEFAKIDPKSFTFRYPVDRDGKLVPVTEDVLDLGRLKEVMAAVEGFFSGCDRYLDHLSGCTP